MSAIFKQDQAKQCEAWGQMDAVQRKIILNEASIKLAELTEDSVKAQQLFEVILSQAARLDIVQQMTGATGESNHLYFAPRGKSMIVGTDNAGAIPVLGLLLTTLLAGNEVILRYTSQQQLCEQAIDILTQSGVYPGVMSIANDSQLTTLLHISRLAVVGAAGSFDELAQIGEDLAETDGILTQLIAITDQEGCREMFEPDYIERFLTERVKTVNTTAIGGNASLLELGVD